MVGGDHMAEEKTIGIDEENIEETAEATVEETVEAVVEETAEVSTFEGFGGKRKQECGSGSRD